MPTLDPAAPNLVRKRKKKKKRKRGDTIGTGAAKAGDADAKIGLSSSLSRKPSDHIFEQDEEHPGRSYTVSVAIPGSIVSNAQSPELRTYLVGQIARALTIFEVDEIVVYTEDGSTYNLEGEFKGSSRRANPNVFMARILQYLETPQYLRKELFPMHPDLKFAGLLNPLDAPHHVRMDTPSPYREGVVVRRPTKPGAGSWVNVGLKQNARIDVMIPAGTRVTVSIPEREEGVKKIRGKAVAPSEPRTKAGLYWGYTTRLAGGIGKVLSECPYKGGYDVTIGTSERGVDATSKGFALPTFRHLLIVFGGLGGLEDAVEGDESLPAGDPESLFSMYMNSCTSQGSRTIRTEEALPITLSLLRPHILHNKV